MRLVIDMQGAQSDSRFRGIGRYTISIVQALLRRAAPHHEVLLAVNAQMPESIWSIRSAFDGLLSPQRIRVFDVPAQPDHGGWDNEASEPIREAFLASLKPDVVLVTSVIEGYWNKAVTSIGRSGIPIRTAAILYDLIPFLHPEKYITSPQLADYLSRKKASLKAADLLLAISSSSRQEALDHLGMDDDQVVNISASIDAGFAPVACPAPEKERLLKHFGIDRKYILYAPGGFDPRKNFARLIEAYSLMPEHLRADYQLVIVSKLGDDSRRALLAWRDQYRLASDELVLTGYVPDQDLIALYSFTNLFVFPSLHEGFGLPVLEAMACGAPVIGSNCTSVPEVIGWEEALFDPLSVASIRNKLVQALTDKRFWSQLKQRSLVQAAQFSWDGCADRAWQALEDLHSRPPTDPPPLSSQHLLEHVTKVVSAVDTARMPADSSLRRAAQCINFNMGSKRRQLLLDVSELARSDARTGIQRVVRNLLLEIMLSPPPGIEVRPIRFDGQRYWYANRLAAGLTKTEAHGSTDEVADFYQDDIYLCLDLLMHLEEELQETHVQLAARGVSLNYIVYDLLPLQHPQWWADVIGPMFLSWITALSKRANRMICISQAVATELAHWWQEHPVEAFVRRPAIRHFHLGADLQNSAPSRGMPDNATTLLGQLNARTTFLMVGTVEPRKGHDQTLVAFEHLWAQGHDMGLVIVGKKGWKVDDLAHRLTHHPQLGNKLLWLSDVSDEFLEKLYSACDCLIMASLGEGFGLPLIEAAQHRLPIICRDLPVLREVAGAHAHYFHGLQPDTLANTILDWQRLQKDGRQPTSDGLPWQTWNASSQQLLQALELEVS